MSETIVETKEEAAVESNILLCGRRKIFVSTDEITEENVISVVNEAISFHLLNMQEEEYLYWYRRGLQPILNRTKSIRKDIIRKVVVNNAEQVCTFKNGYFMTSACSYSSRVDEEAVTERVQELNEYCLAAGKPLADNEVVDWFDTVGLGVLYVELNTEDDAKRVPFHTYALDPRSAFVAYSYRPGNRPVMGVNMVIVNQRVIIDVFTRTHKFVLAGGMSGLTTFYKTPIVGTAYEVLSAEPNLIGEIPIVEYQYNHNRMGSFECAISIMDEINEKQSRLAEAEELQIQQLCVAYNCNFDEDTTADSIRESGMIVLRSTNENKADFKIITTELNQQGSQTTLDALYEQLLDKTGLPNISRGDGGSSDNGSAVYLKSGYSIADTNRRNTEDYWRKSDEQFKRVALKIIKLANSGFDLEPEQFELNIEPPTMSNLLIKTQAALNMRTLGLAPQIWLERSGISNDPLTDIELSKDYIYQFYEAENQTANTASAPMEEEVEQEGEALSDDRQIEELSSMVLD